MESQSDRQGGIVFPVKYGYRLIIIFIILAISLVPLASWFFWRGIQSTQVNVISYPYEIYAQLTLARQEVYLIEQQLRDIQSADKMLSYNTIDKRLSYLIFRLDMITNMLDEVKHSTNFHQLTTLAPILHSLKTNTEELQNYLLQYHPDHLDDFVEKSIIDVRLLKQNAAQLFSDASEFLQQGSSSYVKQLSNIALVILVMTFVIIAILFVLIYSLRLVRIQKNKLLQLSHIDELTGVKNRRSFNQIFQDEMDKSVALQTNLTLIILDIDSFKSYNDTYGHIEGDLILSRVACILSDCLTSTHEWLFRIGGEEFAYLARGYNEQQAKERAERLRLAIEESNIPHGANITSDRITLSLGVAQLPDPVYQGDSRLFFKAADKALYQAKHNGRNQVVIAENIGHQKEMV